MFHRDQMLKRILDGFRILTIFVLVNIAWIPLFLYGKQEAELYWQLQDKGVTTSGTVVKIHRGAKFSQWPEVTFEVNNNSYIFEFHSSMRKYKVDEQVIVRYDPTDPNIALIDSDESWKHPMFVISLAIFLALFLNIIMIWGVWRRIQFNRMAAKAYRLPPQVS
jgi:hypothetical protein